MKILDCTFRDGGYYTDWDFESSVVRSYIDAMNRLPVDCMEVGYRNMPSKKYLGKFGYTPVPVLQEIRKLSHKKIVVMLNEKDVALDHTETLLAPIVGLADMIRIAIDPIHFDRAVMLARTVKSYGFEVGFNCMYMSKWESEYQGFLSKLGVLDDFCDLFCMVDSYGGITPKEVERIYAEVKKNTAVPIGFHGHNNLQLGLINTLTAIQLGADYVDATVLGMGRGAGNLNIELLLTYLNANNDYEVDFNVLGDIISVFSPLQQKFGWGTNLPYMIAGANKIPQKDVMDWVTNRVYSFNSIVRALDNRKEKKVDNAKFPEYKFTHNYQKVIIIGGGNSVIEHLDGIKTFIQTEKNIAVVFATARHSSLFSDVNCPKFYVLVGTESRRMAVNVDKTAFNDTIILPPYPRTMGTDVPEFAINRIFELPYISFINEYMDSCTTIAVQTAMLLTGNQIYAVGYDGYPGSVLSEKEIALTHENKTIFNAYAKKRGQKIESLTPSLYRELQIVSVYQFL